MSSEKLPFNLPGVFTIDFEISKDDSNKASLPACCCSTRKAPRALALALAASIKMEDQGIFQDTKSFKQTAQPVATLQKEAADSGCCDGTGAVARTKPVGKPEPVAGHMKKALLFYTGNRGSTSYGNTASIPA
ncbi:hypothetical protein C2845_PM02G30950 [Panicum miliaceum]|uniref:Uncharacterized protein n=1 Tax=Panicum miliaceum TaxID=4540 RepID=A0A3L6S8K7_PANMI|nr:hypothetical protein C2845_PM02G30950 [Panicum miliaceum]